MTYADVMTEVITALRAMYRQEPIFRAMVFATLVCWALAGVLLLADVLNLVEIPDQR
jgi:hypothetical protein